MINDAPLKLSKAAEVTKKEGKNNNVPFWEEDEDSKNRKSVFGRNKSLGLDLKNNGDIKRNSTLDEKRGSKFDKRNSIVGDYSHLIGMKDAKKILSNRKSAFGDKR